LEIEGASYDLARRTKPPALRKPLRRWTGHRDHEDSRVEREQVGLERDLVYDADDLPDFMGGFFYPAHRTGSYLPALRSHAN
jgi:hypothetical protein